MENKNTTDHQRFVSLSDAAHSLGVPIAWLRSEAGSGKLPALKAGKRILVNVEAVERALLNRSESAEASAR